jgi:predicted TIM-barrel fold metal-dependent hydrolase
MARDGFKIFDADTHIAERLDLMKEYLSSKGRARLEEIAPLLERQGGVFKYLADKKPVLTRRLGTREYIAPGGRPGGVSWAGLRYGPPYPNKLIHSDPHARIQDMDLEGVDVNVVFPSGTTPNFCDMDDVDLELAMYEAFHRFMKDYCDPYPDRLKSVVVASGRNVTASVAELERCSKEPWPVGVFPACSGKMPLDHPDWEPLWAAAEANDLTVIIHSFTMGSPDPPGLWDNWENMFLQRSAAHMWNAQRNLAALIGAGVLDRYPGLRMAAFECGHGWLHSWAARLDEHVTMCKDYIQPLKRKPSEYIRSSQYFQTIQLYEGEESLRGINDLVGDTTLMYASDFPHQEAWFPKSAEIFLGWSMPEKQKRNMLWNNALLCYRRFNAA